MEAYDFYQKIKLSNRPWVIGPEWAHLINLSRHLMPTQYPMTQGHYYETVCKQDQHHQNLSPLILLASWRSLVMMVTLLAWMAHRLVSSKRETKQASAASWRARTAELWNRSSCLNSWAISLTSLWKGSFLMRRSVDFWYFLISLRATVPGLKRWGFLTPVVTGALFLAIFWATSCFLGTFWAVDFLAVCLVLAIYPDKQLQGALQFSQPPIPIYKKQILIGSLNHQSYLIDPFSSDQKRTTHLPTPLASPLSRPSSQFALGKLFSRGVFQCNFRGPKTQACVGLGSMND